MKYKLRHEEIYSLILFILQYIYKKNNEKDKATLMERSKEFFSFSDRR